MSAFRRWLSTLRDVRYVELFATDGLVVGTHERGAGRRLLRRAPAMEKAVTEVVAAGLAREEWRGILYVMAWGPRDSLRPLYVGKAGRWGRTADKLSVNLKNLATNQRKFARWGDGTAYHVGDLSQALFHWPAYKEAGQKYERWAEMLFTRTDPPTLRERTHLFVASWHQGDRGPCGEVSTLEEAEADAIDLALSEFEGVVLNVSGEQWWLPASATSARTPSSSGPLKPFKVVTTGPELESAAAALASAEVIGLDVETTLCDQRLCLIQCATRSETFVIDALAVDDLGPLRRVLEAGPVKVIHNAPFERRVLREHGFELAPIFDTLTGSRALAVRSKGHRLDEVVERHLGRAMDKGPQTSNWAARPLSKRQLEYAALDAEVVLDLYDVLRDPLFRGVA